MILNPNPNIPAPAPAPAPSPTSIFTTDIPINRTGNPDPLGGMSDKLSGKNKQLGLMLFALGGALRGDPNFVKDTIALQKMQEGEEKIKKQKEAYQDFLKTLDPESSMYRLAKAVGYEKLPDLAIEQYKSTQKKVDPSKAIKSEEYNVLVKLKQVGGDISQLNKYEKRIYENYIRGQKPGLADILLSEVAGGSLSLSGGGDEPLVITQVNP